MNLAQVFHADLTTPEQLIAFFAAAAVVTALLSAAAAVVRATRQIVTLARGQR